MGQERIIIMNTSLPAIFTYNNQELFTTTINDETWWVASDVCKVLDIINVSQAVKNLDEDEKGIYNTYTLGGNQSALCVNESGLYHLIFTSRKEEAQRFRKWVTTEVLPSIRKTGGYNSNQNDRIAQLEQSVNMLIETIKHPAQRQIDPLDLEERVFNKMMYLAQIGIHAMTPARLAGSYLKTYKSSEIRTVMDSLVISDKLVKTCTAHAPYGRYSVVYRKR